MDFFERLKNQFVEFWTEVDSSTKLISVIFFIILFFSLGTAIYFNRKPHFSLLGFEIKPLLQYVSIYEI